MFSYIAVVTTALFFSSSVTAQGGNKFLTFSFENDFFVGDDSGFTNGAGVAFGRVGLENFDRTNTPFWIRALTSRLPVSTRKNRSRAISHMFFQRLQTPEDITNPEFQADDLPYVGILAYQGTLFSSNGRDATQLSLFLGIAGPSALGEESQREVHAIIGADEPLGWDTQVRDTPVFKIEYQKTWSLFRTESSTQFEVVALGTVGVGNMETGTEWGFALRIGTDLARSLNAFNLKADRQVNPLAFGRSSSWYAFVGARAGYIAFDILVEGDLPDGLESNLSLEPIRTELAAGFAYGIGRYGLVFQVGSNSSFVEQESGFDPFGALSLTVGF